VTVGALDIGQLLQSAGPSGALLVVIIVVGWFWLRAERRANRIQKDLDDERERHAELVDAERERRRKAEDARDRAKRKHGDLDA
jgi:type II secretory pathway component PulM